MRSSIGIAAPSGVAEVDRADRGARRRTGCRGARRGRPACTSRPCWPCRRWRRPGRRRRGSTSTSPRGHEVAGGDVRDERVRDAGLGQLPGRQPGALQVRPRLVDPDVDRPLRVVGGLDDAERRPELAARQRPGVAVGQDPERPVRRAAAGPRSPNAGQPAVVLGRLEDDRVGLGPHRRGDRVAVLGQVADRLVGGHHPIDRPAQVDRRRAASCAGRWPRRGASPGARTAGSAELGARSGPARSPPPGRSPARRGRSSRGWRRRPRPADFGRRTPRATSGSLRWSTRAGRRRLLAERRPEAGRRGRARRLGARRPRPGRDAVRVEDARRPPRPTPAGAPARRRRPCAAVWNELARELAEEPPAAEVAPSVRPGRASGGADGGSASDRPSGRRRRRWSRRSMARRPSLRAGSVLDDAGDAPAVEAVAALEELELDEERQADDLALEPLDSSIVPLTVPPVASRSSTIRTFWPGWIASRWISSVFEPYSSAYSTVIVSAGSLPSLRTGTRPGVELVGHRRAEDEAARLHARPRCRSARPGRARASGRSLPCTRPGP